MSDAYHSNKSTVSTGLERGWRDRQSKAQNKSANTADWREVDRIRQAHFAELDRKAKAEAEERRARQGLRVACPCCDGSNSITVEFAERVYRALERLPAESAPDELRLAILAGLATDRPHPEPFALHPSLSLHKPRKADPVAMAIHDAPGDDESAIAVYLREEATRAAEIVALSRPVGEAEIAAVEAADHEATMAAVEAADPAPVTITTPTKHRTRRVAPAPFLAGDE